jgi:hypothetical protein
MQFIFSVSPKIDQVNYFSWVDSIFLTTGEHLLDFVNLYQTGPVLAKTSGRKIWSVKSEIR